MSDTNHLPAPLRCKVGDLAVIVRAFNPSNVGLIVRIFAPYDPAAVPWLNEGPFHWLVECSAPLTWSTEGEPSRITQGLWGPVPDECLQPIRGLDTEDKETTSQESSCADELEFAES